MILLFIKVLLTAVNIFQTGKKIKTMKNFNFVYTQHLFRNKKNI